MKAKIGFVLLSNSTNPIPSTRIAILNLFPFLERANYDIEIVYQPSIANETPDVVHLAPQILEKKFDIILFQKVHGTSVEALARILSSAGIKTLYCVCDLVNVAMVESTDATIVVTEFLKSLYPHHLHTKIFVVHDGIEHPEHWKEKVGRHSGSKYQPIQAILVTSASLDTLPVFKALPRWLKVTIVGQYLPGTGLWTKMRQAKWMLSKKNTLRDKLECAKFLMNSRIRRLPWHVDNVYGQMLHADIGIIPIVKSEFETADSAVPSWKVKSENRLTLKMSLGLPVIATPIPAYLPIIHNGDNGFFAENKNEWIRNLEFLRDPDLRLKMGQVARNSVLKRFSVEEQARLFIKVLNTLSSKN